MGVNVCSLQAEHRWQNKETSTRVYLGKSDSLSESQEAERLKGSHIIKGPLQRDSSGKPHALNSLPNLKSALWERVPLSNVYWFYNPQEGLVSLVNFLVFWTLSLAFMSFPPPSKRECFRAAEQGVSWDFLQLFMHPLIIWMTSTLGWVPRQETQRASSFSVSPDKGSWFESRFVIGKEALCVILLVAACHWHVLPGFRVFGEIYLWLCLCFYHYWHSFWV